MIISCDTSSCFAATVSPPFCSVQCSSTGTSLKSARLRTRRLGEDVLRTIDKMHASTRRSRSRGLVSNHVWCYWLRFHIPRKCEAKWREIINLMTRKFYRSILITSDEILRAIVRNKSTRTIIIRRQWRQFSEKTRFFPRAQNDCQSRNCCIDIHQFSPCCCQQNFSHDHFSISAIGFRAACCDEVDPPLREPRFPRMEAEPAQATYEEEE